MINVPEKKNLYIVMDYIKGGAFLSTKFWKYRAKRRNIIYENNKKYMLEEDEIKNYISQLVLGLDYSKFLSPPSLF